MSKREREPAPELVLLILRLDKKGRTPTQISEAVGKPEPFITANLPMWWLRHADSV